MKFSQSVHHEVGEESVGDGGFVREEGENGGSFAPFASFQCATRSSRDSEFSTLEVGREALSHSEVAHRCPFFLMWVARSLHVSVIFCLPLHPKFSFKACAQLCQMHLVNVVALGLYCLYTISSLGIHWESL